MRFLVKLPAAMMKKERTNELNLVVVSRHYRSLGQKRWKLFIWCKFSPLFWNLEWRKKPKRKRSLVMSSHCWLLLPPARRSNVHTYKGRLSIYGWKRESFSSRGENRMRKANKTRVASVKLACQWVMRPTKSREFFFSSIALRYPSIRRLKEKKHMLLVKVLQANKKYRLKKKKDDIF